MAVKKLVKKATTPAPTAAPATSTATGETGTYEGYCVKCKAKGTKFDGEVHLTKSGMNMAKGPCPTCGTTICRIMGKAQG